MSHSVICTPRRYRQSNYRPDQRRGTLAEHSNVSVYRNPMLLSITVIRRPKSRASMFASCSIRLGATGKVTTTRLVNSSAQPGSKCGTAVPALALTHQKSMVD